MITDGRLQYLCSPEYALSEPGQLASELYAARQAIRIISANPHERIEQLMQAVELYGTPRCEYLHHPTSMRHAFGDPCPVEAKINALIQQSKGDLQT